jgi:hypothetical protein
VRLGHDDERGADAVEEAYADVFGVGGGAEGGGDLEAGTFGAGGSVDDGEVDGGA